MEIDIRLLAPIATLFGTSVASYLWYLNRPRKHVSLGVLRAEPLIALRGDARKRLKVMFGDKPLESTHLLHLSLQNDGNTPITIGDYQSPFRIELNADAKILEVDVLETWPADIDRRIPASSSNGNLIKSTEKTAVELTPVLLNPRDEITLQLLVEGFSNYIQVTHHVSGLGRVDFWSESRAIQRMLSWSGIIILVVAAFFVQPNAPFILIWPSIPYCMLLILGASLYVASLLWPGSERKRSFATAAEARKIFRAGKIAITSEVL